MKKHHRGKGFLIKWIVLLFDIVVINGVFLLVYYWENSSANGRLFSGEYKTIILLLNSCYLYSLYFIPIQIQKPIIHMDKVVQQALSSVSLHIILFITCLFFLYQEIFSVHFVITYYLVLYIAFTIWRVIARKTITSYRKTGRNYKTLVIAGAGESGQDLYDEMINEDSAGYKILGFFDDNVLLHKYLGDLFLGNTSDLEQFVLDEGVDEVYCTLPNSQRAIVIHLMNFCEKNRVKFYLVPEYFSYIKKSLVLESIATIPLLSIKPEPLEYPHNRLLKRFLDVIFSSIVLLTVFPVLYIIIGILIKISSSGPILFKQLRTGIYGKDFYCYKFRTMKLNGDADVKQATKNDPRVTKIGAFLRKTNLDEMPQFINVLRGEMSIVGPRPHMISHTKLYSSLIDKYMVRHSIKPGITGWAQINGFRGEVNEIGEMEERVKRDVWYIENWNFVFDLKIIFITTLSMFKKERKNAY
ncbi:MAG: undecaprenyl-phosphate glucose phosphotransferase [Dysgonamonadaceae bacterium]|jgi:putative colanic acid biosynthesis UDP-glucose lipid carrier transferase|nr:undecaprenyl-phosphate glucose phosphotransferase [Dysgonamonadaceae bacterium]